MRDITDRASISISSSVLMARALSFVSIEYLCYYFLLLIPRLSASIYLLHTEDSHSAEFYDCISYRGLLYCRRPTELTPLHRNNMSWQCQHGGSKFSFSELLSRNMSVSTILHKWKSSLEMVERYAEYLQQTPAWRTKHEGFICQCQFTWGYGKYCEYALWAKNSFFESLDRDFSMRRDGLEPIQSFGDIICYRTIQCNTSRLCLDWRDICDGIQQCMYGYDEENCDLLEFHECEDDEYRCMNGMCIPDIYFLDGEYDCMDLSDEIGFFNDSQCPVDPVQVDCDDRMCPPNEWSCGDGQCISNRFAFQTQLDVTIECYSLRDQNYMCELNVFDRYWTMPDGKCLSSREVKTNGNESQDTGEAQIDTDVCVHFFQCAFSEGASTTCECCSGHECFHNFTNPCPSDFVQFPPGTIITPYLTLFYKNPRSWGDYSPDLFQINGTIKCRGYMIEQQLNLTNLVNRNHPTLEYLMCKEYFEQGKVSPGGYDRHCYNHSSEYHEILCPQSRECISPYRVRDGYYNCADKSDENRNSPASMTCSKIKRHRFRCSKNESTCLPVHHLGDLVSDCENEFDESFAGTGRPISKLICNRQSKEDCDLIRQYIEASWTIDYDQIPRQNSTKTLPFRAYCDTFWDLTSKQDENTTLCKQYWQCPQKFWRCRTGQCIPLEWILDYEWDCADASDEQSLFLDQERSQNGNRAEKKSPWDKFLEYYEDQPLASLCNITIEFPCILLNASSPWLDLNTNRPCLHMSRLGDSIVDCVGGIDEKNTLTHCEQSTMLGDIFKCLSTDTCIPYSHVCDNRCPNKSDDDLLCGFQNHLSHCSRKGKDYTCFNGQCLESGWCAGGKQCPHSENHYLCSEDDEYTERVDMETNFYRRKKELGIRYDEQVFKLPSFSIQNSEETTILRTKRDANSTETIDRTTFGRYYMCNRGLHIQLWNQTYLCLCPHFYYGDKCQYHHDRLMFTFHLNFSQSDVVDVNDTSIVMKLLVVFLYEDQIIRSTVFHVRPALEKMNYAKKTSHFIYSRVEKFIEARQKRYVNRTDILQRQPYAIRIESYELRLGQKPVIWAVWQYRLRFDYLPSFRLIKILHLIEFPKDDPTDPCMSNPCQTHQRCHRLLNAPSDYVCLCVENYGGQDCSREEPLCSNEYCASNALCKPDYQGLLNSQSQPYCLCPTNKFGTRCFLEYDRCSSNPCQNGGTCFPTSQPDRYFCHCHSNHQGERCELNDAAVHLWINQSLIHRGALIQYLKIDYSVLDLVLIDQQPFFALPDEISYLATAKTHPQIILAKLYSDEKSSFHIISIELKAQSINRTTNVMERNACPSISTLFEPNEEVSPIKYHQMCNRTQHLNCFYDEQYLCVCAENRSRADCFAYDHALDRCSRCLAQGHCIRGSPSKSDHFICLCPRCHYGTLCQFNTKQFSFTVDSLIVEDSLTVHLLYLALAFAIIVIGGTMNYASFSTFKRPSPRRIGVGNYLLLFAIFSQCSLLILTMKFVHIILSATFGDIPCKMISNLLSLTTRFTYWLMSWITIERVSFVLFPFSKVLRSPRAAIVISCLTILIIAGMHFHELLFYVVIKDPNGQSLCVLSTSPFWLTYDRMIVLIHYIVPFCIQIISTTLLTILTAQSRSTTTANANHRHSFLQQLKRQFHSQRELYFAPIIIILSALPHIILSFAFTCVSLSDWQRHAMLIAYFLSHAPQVLGFFLFILPSSSYSKEFQQTKIAKFFLFQRLSASSR